MVNDEIMSYISELLFPLDKKVRLNYIKFNQTRFKFCISYLLSVPHFALPLRFLANVITK